MFDRKLSLLQLSTVIVIAVALVGCNMPAFKSTSPSATVPSTKIKPTKTQAPTPTVLLKPTVIPPGSTATLTPTQPAQVQIFLIAVGDKGASGKQIGCEDSVVPVEVAVSPQADPILAALESLFVLHDPNYGESGLYNALYQSDFQVEKVAVDADGKATVKLTGSIMLGGVCDNPRVKAQIEETMLQFPDVKQVAVFLNGQKLDDVLSLKGETTGGEITYQKVKIFLIALEDNGASGKPIGCSDSVVPVDVEIKPVQDLAKAVQASLKKLFSARDRYAGGAGLYNALKDSPLKVEGVSISNGIASIKLSGMLLMGGECDIPRVDAQIKETILQFPEIKEALVFLNDIPLEKVLSLK